MLSSQTGTYCPMQATMGSLVNEIITSYFKDTKRALGLLTMQCLIWED
jgi:hypothetical protein